jgi:hypothetical protein
VWAIVRRIDNDRVVRDAQFIEAIEQGADRIVVFDHAVDVLAVTVCVTAAMFGAHMSAKVHPC